MKFALVELEKNVLIRTTFGTKYGKSMQCCKSIKICYLKPAIATFQLWQKLQAHQFHATPTSELKFDYDFCSHLRKPLRAMRAH